MKPLPVLKAADRALAQQLAVEKQERTAAIACEKAERTQAMRDLWAKFQQMEKDLNEVKARPSVGPAAAAAPIAAASAAPQDSNNQSLEELKVKLQAAGEEQKTALKLSEDGINRKLEAHMKEVDALAAQQRT